MADALELVNKFIVDLNTWQEKWKYYVVRPYCIAYDAAHKSFSETLKNQEEQDKLRRDLALTALSICGGGLLTSVFASAALKTIAYKGAVDVICNNNLERVFKAAAWAENNATASFIVGKLWDEAESRLKEKLKISLAPAAVQSQFPSIGAFLKNPLNIFLSLEQFVGEARLKLDDIAHKVRDEEPNAAVQVRVIKQLRNAPFCSPPEKTIDHDMKLADRIELGFYMNVVLDSDSLVKTRSEYGERKPIRTGSTSERIHASPSSSAYPTKKKTIDGYVGFTEEDVAYDSIGSRIGDRIDELYKANGFGVKFFESKGLLGGRSTDRLVLTKAEQTLYQLGKAGIRPEVIGQQLKP